MKIIKLLFAALLWCTVVQAQGIITTVAGTGGRGFTGVGGPATAAQIGGPTSIVFDTKGNYYFMRGSQCIVYKVDTQGIISIFAGSDTLGGYSGDGGPATAATFMPTWVMCMDKHDNIYICDSRNYVIRKVDPSGTISTYAGNGVPSHNGDGGQATAASFYNPTAVTIDRNDNMYIFDDHWIRKISSIGIVSTIAGDSISGGYGDGVPATSAQFGDGVLWLTTDSSGNLYIGDIYNYKIRKINFTTDTITTVAGNGLPGFSGDGGSATAAGIFPAGIYVDKNEILFFVDAGNERIRKVDRNGLISTIAGNGIGGYAGDGGNPLLAQFYYPNTLTFDTEGNIYIADGSNYRIRKITYVTNVYEVSDSTIYCTLYPNPSN